MSKREQLPRGAGTKGGGRPVLGALPSLWPCVVQSRWRRERLSGVQPALDSLSTGPETDKLRETKEKLTSPSLAPNPPRRGRLCQGFCEQARPPCLSLSPPFTTGDAGCFSSVGQWPFCSTSPDTDGSSPCAPRSVSSDPKQARKPAVLRTPSQGPRQCEFSPEVLRGPTKHQELSTEP